MTKNLKPSSIPILGMLASNPMSGYELKQKIEKTTGYFWNESYGQLYPQLKYLSENGYIKEIEQDNGDSKRVKKSYTIADKGRNAMKEWLSKPPKDQALRVEILLKIFFANQGDHEQIRQHIIEHKEKSTKTINALFGIKNMINEQFSNHPDAKFWLITLDHGIKTYQATINWADESLNSLNQ